MTDTILRLENNQKLLDYNKKNIEQINSANLYSGYNIVPVRPLIKLRRNLLKERHTILDTLSKDLNWAIIEVNNELKLF
tara:strand:+ start:691 stop:927 length:237 start_codon:yes stop_codon:yes gene_type:complete